MERQSVNGHYTSCPAIKMKLLIRSQNGSVLLAFRAKKLLKHDSKGSQILLILQHTLILWTTDLRVGIFT